MCEAKHLLPQVERYFKANLHTHSTISDGKLTREEIKQAYKALGYQILCLTDHNTIVNHSDMNEPDFLMLTGVEINVNAPDKCAVGGQTYHLNLIAKDPDNLWFPARCPRWFAVSEEMDSKIQYDTMDIQYNPDSINAMIAKANEKGFLVMYNHPTWSCQTYANYAPLKGLWGMELRNTECCLIGHNENNFRVYKDLLTLGNRIFPLGTDDTHSPRALGKSWIMVGASDLNYGSVIEALENGDFYMSCGPEITELCIEGDVLKVTCSDAQRINLETHGRMAQVILAENEPLREAEFNLGTFFSRVDGDPDAFVYVTVTAPDGSYATTRPYYLKDLL
ncbi:MAG: CehA/McbA family metallohydrolase [Clostridia bacterium]|nr:CehA/McbA family metallohydrolase [Clostridia bacterium]